MVVVGQRARMARDRLREMLGAAVGEIVAVDRGDDDVGKPELEGRLRHVLRLGGVERAGHAGLDVAEGAGAGAGVAHDHEGGVLLVPALADVRAAGLLAHRDEAVFLDDLAGVGIAARDSARAPGSSPVSAATARPAGSPFGVARAQLASAETVSTRVTMECLR